MRVRFPPGALCGNISYRTSWFDLNMEDHMQKMDDFANKAKDFLIKYKRYLGAGVLFIVFVLVLVNCTGPKNDVTDTQVGTETVVTEAHTEYPLKGNLEKSTDQELIDLITNYYTAYAGGDCETLESLASPLSDNEKSYIGALSDYYEKYENITCYTMPGATDDSYLVSVCYDLKFYEVDTPAPGMDFFYVERNGKGNLYINNAYSSYNFNFLEEDLDADLYSLIISYEKSDDVKALQTDVQSRYEEAVSSDDKLANMVGGTLRTAISNWRKAVADTQTSETQQGTQVQDTQKPDSTQADDTKTEDTQKDSENTDVSTDDTKTDDSKKDDSKKDTKKSTKVKTTDICNVRAKASTDAEILGRVDIGVKLKKLGTSGEWTKVKFQGKTGYIKSDLLKEVK